jgi:hypothetical protein
LAEAISNNGVNQLTFGEGLDSRFRTIGLIGWKRSRPCGARLANDAAMKIAAVAPSCTLRPAATAIAGLRGDAER